MHAAGLVATAVLQHAAQRRSAVVQTCSCIYMCVCPIVFWLQVADPISLSENIVKYIYTYMSEPRAACMHRLETTTRVVCFIRLGCLKHTFTFAASLSCLQLQAHIHALGFICSHGTMHVNCVKCVLPRTCLPGSGHFTFNPLH